MVTNKNSMTNTMMTMKTIRKYKAQTRAKAIAIAMISFRFFCIIVYATKINDMECARANVLNYVPSEPIT